jgi:CheY-like chemotaxis protein
MLTETMGGEITVRSEIGRGSTFSVKLMLSDVVRPRDAAPVEDRVRGYAGPRQTIMITDDDPVHRGLICELLEPLGFNVITAPDGAACLALADEHRPKLVLLDMTKPINLRQLLDKIHTLLGIEWIVDEDAAPASEALQSAHAQAEGASAPLSAGDMETLIRLGEIGHVRGITTALDEIERNAPHSMALITELRTIVHSFNFGRFLAVLKAQRSDHAS